MFISSVTGSTGACDKELDTGVSVFPTKQLLVTFKSTYTLTILSLDINSLGPNDAIWWQ